MPPYVVLEKPAGETPLQTLTRYREQHENLKTVPMAYAGRLDPMASGKLLILIGDECKKQAQYHKLDKTYRFEILFGVSSDTGDIMGRLTPTSPPTLTKRQVADAIHTLPRSITLPYPPFSAKTVAGKPLHTWTLEGRLSEITIPTYTTTLYQIQLTTIRTIDASTAHTAVRSRIDQLPTVTEASKHIGADFRRNDVRADWRDWLNTYHDHHFPLATITCTVTAGTYMRSLAPYIASQLATTGLAYSIHRSRIGHYQPLWGDYGWWRKTY